MLTITMQDLLLTQPNFPKEMPTDKWYLDLSNRLARVWHESDAFRDCPDPVRKRVVLAVTGYYQDVISDAGLWRSFIAENKRMYGRWLPFYEIPEDYIEYEINAVDVRFLVWYVLAMLWEPLHNLDPMSAEVERLADLMYAVLDDLYEDAPDPEGYNLAKNLDPGDPADADALYALGSWLFLHSYLLTPSYAPTLARILQDPEVAADKSMDLLRKRLEQSMFEDPIGPLAFFLRQWVLLLTQGKLPADTGRPEAKGPHPFYTKFMAANGGEPVRFFGSYQDMNRFLIEALGWEKDTEHLPQLKESRDFAVYVTEGRGMLVARDVCRCILHPLNPYYNEEYAKRHAIEFFTVQGRCPVDLLRYLAEGDRLPDAAFDNAPDSHRLLMDNWDFMARCYLQLFYTD